MMVFHHPPSVHPLHSFGSANLCVVLMGNGKKRNSFVDQTREPQWNGKAFIPSLLASIIKDENLAFKTKKEIILRMIILTSSIGDRFLDLIFYYV